MFSRPIVGRTEEIDQMREHAERAAAGVRQLVVVEGRAEFGKSALLRHALAPYRHWNGRWIWLDTPDQDKPGSLARQLMGRSADDIPGVFEQLDGLVDYAVDRMSEAVGPRLIVIEDVHAADGFSLHGLWRVIRKLKDVPGLIVLTTRPSDRPEVTRLARLAQTDPDGSHLRLSPFGLAEAKQLLTEYVGHPVGDGVVQRVLSTVGGTPGAVEFVGRWLRRTPFGSGRSIELALDNFACEHQERTVSQRQSVTESLQGLSPEVTCAIEMLAVADRPVRLTELGRMIEIDQIDAEALLSSGLIEWHERRSGYRVRDQYVADVIVRQMTPTKRAQHHLRLAPLHDGRWALQHRTQAMLLDPSVGDLDDLIKELLSAGEHAYGAGSYEHAFECFRDICRFAPTVQVISRAVQAAMAGDLTPRLVELEPSALALPPGPARTGVVARIALIRGQHERAFRELEQMRELPHDDPTSVLLYAAAVVEAGRQGAVSGMFERGVDVFNRTYAVLGPMEAMLSSVTSTSVDPREQQRAQEMLAAIAGFRAVLELWRSIDHGNARLAPYLPELLTDLIARLESQPGTESVQLALRMVRGYRLRQIGAFPQAYDDLRHASSGRPSDRYIVHARAELALTLFGAGLWDDAAEAAAQGVSDVLEVAEDAGALIAYAASALVPAARGRPQVTDLVDRLDQVRMTYGPLLAAVIDWVRAWSSIAADNHVQAVHYLRRIDDNRAGWATLGVPPIALLARHLFRAEQGEVLAEIVDRIHDPAIPSMDGPRNYAANHAQGLRAWGNREPERAMEHFQDALAWLDEEPPLRPSVAAAPGGGLAIYRAILALDIADLVTRFPKELADHRTAATTVVSWAHTVFDRCAATTLASQATGLRSALRAKAPNLPAGPVDGGAKSGSSARTDDRARLAALAHLTARERQVAFLVADGKTNREVAQDLVVSVRTVEYHVANALAKLGVRSRFDLRRLLRS